MASAGQGGSTRYYDSYLEMTLPTAGVYKVVVSSYPGVAIPDGAKYLLQVSIEEQQ